MTDVLYVVRYFQVVPPVPRLIVLCFVALTLIGAGRAALGQAGDAAAAVPIAVLQAFSVSTGFIVPARRGYFDLLMARGQSCVRIASVQWMVASVPGLCSWGALACASALVHGADNPFVRSGTVIAFLMASTITWAANVSLPRFSGAIGWLLLVCLASSGGVIWPDSVIDLIVPLGVIGRPLTGRYDVLVPGVTLSVGSMALALTWIRRTDIRLQAAQ
jgi:hypothetical protein